MNSPLEDCFHQIVYSEQYAQARRQYLTQLKNEIGIIENRIKYAKEERKTLSGQIFLKSQKLSEKEILLRWLKDKEAILSDQLKNLTETKKQALEDMNRLIEQAHLERRNFCKETKQFATEYGANERGKMARKEKVKMLEQEQLALQSELDGSYDRLRTVQSLRKEIATLTQELSDLKKCHEEKKIELKAIETKLESVLQEKEKINHVPETGREFKRLRREIESFKEDSLEPVCAALHQELRQLQGHHLLLTNKLSEDITVAEKDKPKSESHVKEGCDLAKTNTDKINENETMASKLAHRQKQWKKHQKRMNGYLSCNHNKDGISSSSLDNEH